jgi:hypothetical protein
MPTDTQCFKNCDNRCCQCALLKETIAKLISETVIEQAEICDDISYS